MHELSKLRPERRRRKKWPLVTAGLLVPALVAGGVIWVTRTSGSPEATAEAFLSAWSRQDYAVMKGLVNEAPADFTAAYQRFAKELRLTAASFEAGEPRQENEEGRIVPFTARLRGAVDWTYEGRLAVGEWDGTWKVAWSTTAIHPKLGHKAAFKVVTSEPETAPITAADGTRIDGSDAPGSVQQLVEGLKETYKDRVTGSSSTKLNLYKGDTFVETVAEKGATKGKPLETSIDLRVHRAGADALENVSKPASLVAIRPSTGEILAVANKPGGFNRALLGKYPPGSTFKVVTASALVADGLQPDKTVRCPAEQNIGGFPFHNAGFRDFGTLPFRDAFAHSCNTTFGAMAVSSLQGGRLGEVAASFGFGAPIMPGVPAVRAEFPAPRDDTDLASASIGQGPRAGQPAQHGRRGRRHRQRHLAPAQARRRRPGSQGRLGSAQAGTVRGRRAAHPHARGDQRGHRSCRTVPRGVGGQDRHGRVRLGQGTARALVVHRLPGRPGLRGGRGGRGSRLGGRRPRVRPLPPEPELTTTARRAATATRSAPRGP
ncbi:hypothetical protein FHR33_004087 [Nonomuraea dietziae]|uniref:Uncharacterized protein n=1 Tax=Nonomuraea dietziae TaxID=65515 RepID=A0A7W5YP77_9ACTN|nr:hypothetical protein [Nonomuraea dietziae]